MQLIKRLLTICMVGILLLSVMLVPTSAQTEKVDSAAVPYDTYVYDYNGNPVITPHAYTPEIVFDGEDIGVGALNSPADLEVDEAGNVYIVDMAYQVDMTQLTNIADTQPATTAEEEPETEEVAVEETTTEEAATDEAATTEEDTADEDAAEESVSADASGDDGFYGRLIILNPDYTVKKIITTFQRDGMTDGFLRPQGVTIAQDGSIYIADTDHGRIVRLNQDGSLIEVFADPKISYFEDDFTYLPTKLAVDGSYNIFVVATSVNYGIILLDSMGEFAGFVGAQQVTYNVVDYIWKNLLSEEAASRMESFVPTEYNNVKIDEKGFVYATTAAIEAEDIESAILSGTADSKTSPVKRLNPTGNDVLLRNGYFSTVGDIAFEDDSLGEPATSVFEDVALGPNGRYTVLDSRKNRLFTYSSDGELIYAFSAEGNRAGNSKLPVSITYQGSDLLLLDQANNRITVYKTTEYGALIDEAYACYKQYDYVKAVEYWEKVLNENANFDIAYDGIGNALMQEERYEEATQYFKYSNNMDRYSTAFMQYRASLIEDYLLIIAAVVIVLLFLLAKLFGWIGKRNKDPKYADKHSGFLNQVLYGFYIILHPFDGFWDVKHEKRGGAKAATVIALFLIVARLISKFFTNQLFNASYGTQISIFNEICVVMLPLLLWTVSNWCVTTLADGEGKVKDVYVFSCYALLPMALFTLLNTVLSHFLTLDEGMYITFFGSLGLIWAGFLFFAGNTQTHRYTVGKSILSILMALIGMAIIVFLVLVVFTTYQQIYGFIDSIIKEITYRI